MVAAVVAVPGGALIGPAIATPDALAAQGIHKIKHVVIIMQENRSFDSYFGTYPGADGIPGLAGNPGQGAVRPRPDGGTLPASRSTTRADINAGGPHMAVDAHRRTSTAAR